MEWASSVNVNKEICKTSTREYSIIPAKLK